VHVRLKLLKVKLEKTDRKFNRHRILVGQHCPAPPVFLESSHIIRSVAWFLCRQLIFLYNKSFMLKVVLQA